MSSSIEATDNQRMDEALALARRGLGQTAPNPMVGCVIYNGRDKVGEGFHSRFGEAHAEVVALREAGEKARGATLYVTLEPCAHHGKTPPCADAIERAGVSRVVAAVKDPSPVAKGGAEILIANGIPVKFGVRDREARELNAPFFYSMSSDRPWVTLKLALSLDGALSGADRSRGWLTGPESREVVQQMRASSDAIAVGVSTAVADDPHLTARTDPLPRVPPLRVVFDRRARLPAEGNLARTAREIPTVVITAAGTRLPSDLERCGVEQIRAADVHDALEKLRARGVLSLMVEGGAGLAASFLAGDYVDRMVLFQAPIILGEGSLGAFSGISSQEIGHAPRFTLLETKRLGDDVMSVYSLRRD